MTERHIYGCPGTGKTTQLARIVEKLVRDGTPPGQIYITSFSRVAARTIASRVESIPSDNIGTLQSFGYRAMKLEKDSVLDAFPAGMKRPKESHPIHEWNKLHPVFGFTFAEKGGIPDDALAMDDISEIYDRFTPLASGATGRNALQSASIYRHRMVPMSEWHDVTFGSDGAMGSAIQAFHKHWQAFKYEHDLVDFTDMVEIPYRDCLPFDGSNPVKVLVVDEAQDLTPLMIARVIQVYEQYMKLQGGDLYVALDDDQTLFSHTGCTPEPWFERERAKLALSAVLPQSYRMPQRVHQYSQRIAKMIPHRKDKTFAPMDEIGEVTELAVTYNNVSHELDRLMKASPDETWMILATTNFYANLCASSLRFNAIPFWNPHREENPYWNPLHGTRGVRTVTRLAAWLKPSTGRGDWTLRDLEMWKELVNCAHGRPTLNKARIDAYIRDYPDLKHQVISPELLDAFFRTRDGYISCLNGDAKWLAEHWRSTVGNYPLTILLNHGAQAIIDDPRVIVGTIHSVKGAEVDNVIMMPDMSRAAMDEYMRDPTQMLRTMYVGITRAKRRVYLGWPKDPRQPHFAWPEHRRSRLGEYVATALAGNVPSVSASAASGAS